MDREAVDALVADADVVIHLAFIIMGSREESARINLQGTRNVFEATVAAQRPRRLVYTSSVAAYGYHADNPVPLTEDVPARGSPEHYYSEQKAACEAALTEITADSSLEVFVLRPCIVAGPKARALADAMPWNQLPAPVRAVTGLLPVLKPVLPDPGFRCSWSTTTTSPRRSRWRRRLRHRPARTTSPATGWSPCQMWPRRWAAGRCECRPRLPRRRLRQFHGYRSSRRRWNGCMWRARPW
ncbi:NAD dependent epimerase/dehydratase family protein [Mycobacterium xenopi 3993]|nr:NAD dependent epimerase/dehydratase family protein [Mycobacterium xenopi 3993]